MKKKNKPKIKGIKNIDNMRWVSVILHGHSGTVFVFPDYKNGLVYFLTIFKETRQN